MTNIYRSLLIIFEYAVSVSGNKYINHQTVKRWVALFVKPVNQCYPGLLCFKKKPKIGQRYHFFFFGR